MAYIHHLHPDQKVRIEGFEKIEKPFNDYFDLAVSNIPFGDVAVFDPAYTAHKGMKSMVTKRIHNYFFVKALDAVRDGGLVAFITSQGVLNAKNNSAARFMMLHHADIVSAIRLPNNLFTENANTEVGSDLIILQKNQSKEALWGDDNLLDMVTNDPNHIPTNSYFIEHPERIIHTTAKLDTDPFGKPAMIYTRDGGVEGITEDLRKMLHEDFVKNLNLNRYLGIADVHEEKLDSKEKVQTPIYNKVGNNQTQPPVQMTLFELWEMEGGSYPEAKKSTKKKETIQTPKEIAQEKPGTPVLPGDEPYANISWEENQPQNGFYELMMTMTPEARVALRQKAEEHRQEQLKALGIADTLDAKFKPPMEPLKVLKAQMGQSPTKENKQVVSKKFQCTTFREAQCRTYWSS